MANAVLLAGGNLGNREKLLSDARKLILKDLGKIKKKSSIYETQPWGFNNAPYFLNQAVEIETKLDPEELLCKILEIEKKLGRERAEYGKSRYTSRKMDIDIIFYDRKIIKKENLKIPHPRLHKRRFVLAALKEIIPDFVHPEYTKENYTITRLYKKCNDPSEVYLY